jgi:glycerol-3-phosphate dehydrogenase
MAPAVAKLMAAELHHNKKWQKQQVEAYTRLAQDYILAG